MPKKRTIKRKGRRGRFKSGVDDQRQLDEITEAQKLAREGIIHAVIDSRQKSEQRLRNRLRGITDADDAKREFEGDAGIVRD